jgi:hypothetical protein
MAERMKKTAGPGGLYLKSHHRHGSVDEKQSGEAIIIQSTNDSRVEEMLPNVR